MSKQTLQQKIAGVHERAARAVAKEIERLEMEETLTSHLPEAPGGFEWRLCNSSLGFMSADLEPVEYRGWRMSIREAFEFRKLISPAVIGEHWQCGPVNTWPAEVNPNAKGEGAKKMGSSVVCLELDCVHANGLTPGLEWWARLPCGLVKVRVAVVVEWAWRPRLDGGFNQRGEWSGTIIPAHLGEDKFIQWWSPKPSYRIGYYWESEASFSKWVSLQK